TLGLGVFLGLGTLASALFVAFPILGLEIVVIVLVLAEMVLRIRMSEKGDHPQDNNPTAKRVGELMAIENQVRQNHLAAISELKPGWYRRLALRYALWVVGNVGPYFFPQGTLSGIRTIHFARWVVLPGTNKLLFFSNYDG